MDYRKSNSRVEPGWTIARDNAGDESSNFAGSLRERRLLDSGERGSRETIVVVWLDSAVSRPVRVSPEGNGKDYKMKRNGGEGGI